MPGHPFRIVFMGTPDFAIPSLETMIKGPDEVVAVVTQPDRPKGRGRKPSPLRSRLSLNKTTSPFCNQPKSKPENIEKPSNSIIPMSSSLRHTAEFCHLRYWLLRHTDVSTYTAHFYPPSWCCPHPVGHH